MRHQPYLSLVEQAISSERLRPYRRSPQEADVAVHARYLWNVALSEALYPPLQALEVALRNGIHAAATGAFGSATWFHQRLSDQVPVLQPDQRAQVARTTIDLTRRLAPQGRVATPGDVVASLPFGFWTTLFSSRYEGPNLLWPRLLATVFPFIPRRMRTRRTVAGRLDQIRKLRNRAFHHEPIWNRRDLAGEHATIVETVGWLSPPLLETTGLYDRFPTIHRLGPAPYAAMIATLVRTRPSS